LAPLAVPQPGPCRDELRRAKKLTEKQPDRQFRFVSRLEQPKPGGYYAVDVPVRISKALGKRGPVAVSALINGVADFRASLSPAGGGRHRLRINSRTRKIAEAEAGDSVKVQIVVHSQPPKVAIPTDLKSVLEAEALLDAFQAYAPGKQNHIIEWIGQAAHRETREKRIQLAIEVTHRRHEKQILREARKSKRNQALEGIL
jgi:hypothetical protein